MDGLRETIRAELDRAFPTVCEALGRLVAVPSVTPGGGDAAALQASAEAVALLLRESGLPDVRIVSAASGRPAVLGRRPAPPGARTVLLYAHHDVQPADDPGAWTTGPFVPSERGGRLYGRGAADNKAGIAVHAAAIRAHGGEPPVGLAVLVEGEEEVGSPTFGALLDEHRDLLRADVLVVADSATLEVGQPSLTVSLRGLVDCTVELRTLDAAVHSGVFGGIHPDALSALARLLATLHDDEGRVAVAGLDGAAVPGLALDGAQLRRNARGIPGVLAPADDAAVARRAWTEPALSVLGVDAPTVDHASNQLLPVARARVSLRVPPGMRAAHGRDRLAAHLREHAPWGAQLQVTVGHAADPFLLDVRRPEFGLAEAAFADAWGVPPIRIGTGGTIPVVAELVERFPGAPVIMFGAADRTSNTHGVDESVDLGELRRTAFAEALLLAGLGG